MMIWIQRKFKRLFRDIIKITTLVLEINVLRFYFYNNLQVNNKRSVKPRNFFVYRKFMNLTYKKSVHKKKILITYPLFH